MDRRRPEYEQLRIALRELRRERGLSQFRLARLLGPDVRQEFVSKYEIGERRLDVIEVIDIARALDVNLTTVLDRASIPYE